MQHSGAVELYRSGTDAQAMGNRLVRFAQDQSVENLPFARGKLGHLVSCLADAPLDWSSWPGSPTFDGRKEAA